MKEVPAYTDIFKPGDQFTEDGLLGTLLIEEKIDGSFFAFGINEDGELVARSKNRQLDINVPDQLFEDAIKYVVEIFAKSSLRDARDIYFYGEYLKKPKHNALAYGRVPKNNIILFDIKVAGQGGALNFVPYQELQRFASEIGLEVVPALHYGPCDKDQIENLMKLESILGGCKQEGVVVKNFTRNIVVRGRPQAIYLKFVNPEFKERNQKEHEPNTDLPDFLLSFKTEARWNKVVQHLRDDGKLIWAMQDMPILMKELYQDILKEETDNIKAWLFDYYKDVILRNSNRGFADWYKNYLTKRLEVPVEIPAEFTAIDNGAKKEDSSSSTATKVATVPGKKLVTA